MYQEYIFGLPAKKYLRELISSPIEDVFLYIKRAMCTMSILMLKMIQWYQERVKINKSY